VQSILSSPITSLLGDGQQFQNNYPPDTCDLGILSGQIDDGTFSTKSAVLQLAPTEGIPNKWTFEFTVKFFDLPTSFGDLANQHLYFGIANSAGPVAGVFFSYAGVAYAGDIRHTGPNNDLVLNGPVQQLPGTADVLLLDTLLTVRMSVDGDVGVVYLYVTPLESVPFTGHRLVAVLPALGVAGLAYTVFDRMTVSVKGTTARPTRVAINSLCMAATSVVPNLPPIADAGPDQAIRLCSVLRLDGSASFDPEGVTLAYLWRLVDGPTASVFVASGFDGRTYPLAIPTGFTNKLYSVELGLQHAVDPFAVGDVLTLGGKSYDILSYGSDVNGFYAQLAAQFLDDSLASASFRVVRQRGLSNKDQVRATFLPDVTGFYRFDLQVNDGMLISTPAVVVANAVESILPRGITPDLGFMFAYLSDFWTMVEGRERIEVLWSSLAQVAASELWTLWQLEYSKSLRDIQRTFVRRWLHYDLLLGEPLPELTKARVLYSGVLSAVIPSGGLTGYTGNVTLASSAFEADETFSLLYSGTVTVAQAVLELRNRLQEIDPRFAVVQSNLRDGSYRLRVTAPFPFQVKSSTSTLLVSGATSGLAEGSGGARIGPRVYRTGVNLSSLGIQENDMLIVGGETYLIAAVSDEVTDNVPFQRVTLKTDLPLTAPPNWVISGYATSEMLNFYDGLVSPGDELYFEVADSLGVVAQTRAEHRIVKTTVLGVVAGMPSAVAFNPLPLNHDFSRSDVTVYLAKVVRRTYIPVDERIVDVPTLVEHIQLQDDRTTLHFNLDFFREEFRGRPCLRFVSGATGGPSIWEAGSPPDRLWAEYTYLDNNELIEAHFGIPADFTLDDLSQLAGTVDYLSAVQGLWYAFFGGPTLKNLRVGSQILLGLPFAAEAGYIEEIRTDFSPKQGRILIRDRDHEEIVRSYTFVKGPALEVNPATGAAYAVGDLVQQFAPLVQGVDIVDWVKDPKWMQGFVSQGVLYEIEKFHRFLVRVDSQVFNLPALLFARRFLLKVKPTWTFPLFVVRVKPSEAEVEVVSEMHQTVSVHLEDAICSAYSSHIFDDIRTAGGGHWNQFDNQQGTSLPTFPIPDSPVDWAYDRYVICPSDTLQLVACTQHPGGPPTFDSVFIYDTGVTQRIQTLNSSGPFTIPTGATGLTLTAAGSMTVARAGTFVRARVLITGGPGASPTNYELIVSVNGTDQTPVPFTATPSFTDVTATIALAAPLSATIGLRIRHGGGTARNPSWTVIEAFADVDSGVWAFDVSLPAARYCGVREVA
jgi:hypothetical protein